ncbi:helix-turn-helix domain-containing protein [Streptomyces sp. NPDC057638]|uniref:helix-turn-helix domain-containing protein n=1 Tax=Streptomyces sp. NPDC057638 TaxID=3346190 RepID=UPI0036C07C33
MSIQLMIAAAYLPPDVLNPSQKLALMKLADSADDETRLSRPGLVRLAAWVGVTDKRAITLVTELIAKGLVERVQTGKAGRSATYKVFPLGVPPTPTTLELKEAAEARRSGPKNPRKARSGVARAAPARPAMTYRDVEARVAERQRRESAQVDAGFHEENPEEAGFHGRNPEDGGRVPPVEPDRFHGGNPLGSSGETPSFPGSSSALPFPPPPAADAAGEHASAPDEGPSPEAAESIEGCARHRGRPAASCRGCGTNPRAERKIQEDRVKAQQRAENRQFWKEWHEGTDARVRQAGARAEATAQARREAREAAMRAKCHVEKGS